MFDIYTIILIIIIPLISYGLAIGMDDMMGYGKIAHSIRVFLFKQTGGNMHILNQFISIDTDYKTKYDTIHDIMFRHAQRSKLFMAFMCISCIAIRNCLIQLLLYYIPYKVRNYGKLDFIFFNELSFEILLIIALTYIILKVNK